MQSFFNPQAFEMFIERVNAIDEHTEPKWGKMHAAQMMQHLVLGIGGGLKKDSLPDVSNLFSRTILKWGVLYIAPGFPKNAPTARPLKINYNVNFAEAKQQLQDVLHAAYHTTSDAEWYAHPLFGRMSRSEWGKLITKHLDHHLKQFGV